MAQRGIPFGKRPPGRGGDRRGGAQGGGPRRGPKVFSVCEAVEAAHRALEQAFPAMWVEGEVSNLVLPRSGHAYFTLKDERAALPSAMWASSVRRLRFRLEEGQRLRVFGRLGIYAAQGRFQLYADRAEPAGLGELTLQLEQLKRKLAEEGLFANDRKRPLPPWPKAIGVVTSPNGAAIHDILKVIRRRMPTPVLLSPAKVQGPDAPFELIAALRRLQRVEGVEVVIIGRGGGSIEDLWAFNHEGLARAIAACPVPVVAAIGHEVDVTICDLVADRRAATPSQAGELVVPDRRALLERFADRRRRLIRNLERRSLDLGGRLQRNSSRLERWGRSWVAAQRAELAQNQRRLSRQVQAEVLRARRHHRALAERLDAVHPRARVAGERRRLHELERRLVRAGKSLTTQLRPRLARAAGKLDALSPLGVLGRGYALVQDEQGALVRAADQVEIDAKLRVRLGRGELQVRVDDRELDEKEKAKQEGSR